MKLENEKPGVDVIKQFTHFVVMTDNFLSGWGMAAGKEMIYIYCCRSAEEADIVKGNAKYQGSQKKPTIHNSFPHKYFKNLEVYRVHVVDETDQNRSWYTKDYFKDMSKK